MTSNGFDRESVEFQATVKAELRHIWRDIGLLWDSNSKRRKEIEAIKSRINGAVYSLAIAALGMIFAYLIKPKLGL